MTNSAACCFGMGLERLCRAERGDPQVMGRPAEAVPLLGKWDSLRLGYCLSRRGNGARWCPLEL